MGLGGKLLGRGCAMRKHLDVDAGLVHFLQAHRAEIEKPFIRVIAAAGFGAGVMLGQFRIPVMLFDGDDRAIRLFHHDASPRNFLRPLPSNAGRPCHDLYPQALSQTRQACVDELRAARVKSLAFDPTQLFTGYAADSTHNSSRRRIPRHFNSGPGTHSASGIASALDADHDAGARRIDPAL